MLLQTKSFSPKKAIEAGIFADDVARQLGEVEG